MFGLLSLCLSLSEGRSEVNVDRVVLALEVAARAVDQMPVAPEFIVLADGSMNQILLRACSKHSRSRGQEVVVCNYWLAM